MLKNYWRDLHWTVNWKKYWRQSKSMDVILSEICVDDTVLDLGCGRCHLCKVFNGKTYTGVDISPVLIEQMKELYGDKFICLDLADLNTLEEQYDIVVMRDTLEGMKDWKEVARQALRLARKKLIIVLRRNVTQEPTRLVESDESQGIYVWDINEKELLDITGGTHSFVEGDSVIIRNI